MKNEKLKKDLEILNYILEDTKDANLIYIVKENINRYKDDLYNFEKQKEILEKFLAESQRVELLCSEIANSFNDISYLLDSQIHSTYLKKLHDTKKETDTKWNLLLKFISDKIRLSNNDLEKIIFKKNHGIQIAIHILCLEYFCKTTLEQFKQFYDIYENCIKEQKSKKVNIVFKLCNGEKVDTNNININFKEKIYSELKIIRNTLLFPEPKYEIENRVKNEKENDLSMPFFCFIKYDPENPLKEMKTIMDDLIAKFCYDLSVSVTTLFDPDSFGIAFEVKILCVVKQIYTDSLISSFNTVEYDELKYISFINKEEENFPLRFKFYTNIEIASHMINKNFKKEIVSELKKSIVSSLKNVSSSEKTERALAKQQAAFELDEFLRNIEKKYKITIEDEKEGFFVVFPHNIESCSIKNNSIRYIKEQNSVPNYISIRDNSGEEYYVINFRDYLYPIFKCMKNDVERKIVYTNILLNEYHQKVYYDGMLYVIFNEDKEIKEEKKDFFFIESKNKKCLVYQGEKLYFDQETSKSIHEDQSSMNHDQKPIISYGREYEKYPTHKLCSEIIDIFNAKTFLVKLFIVPFIFSIFYIKCIKKMNKLIIKKKIKKNEFLKSRTE